MRPLYGISNLSGGTFLFLFKLPFIVFHFVREFGIWEGGSYIPTTPYRITLNTNIKAAIKLSSEKAKFT